MMNERQTRALNKLAREGYKKLRPFRKVRKMLLEHRAGSHYGASGGNARPINLQYQISTILVPLLVSGETKVGVGTETPGLNSTAELTQLALELKFKKMHFTEMLEEVVIDAHVGMGWTKTARMPDGEPPGVRGYRHMPGQPYTDRVSLDDILIDPLARKVEESMFIGDRYRLPKSVVEESGLYNPEAFTFLTSIQHTTDEPKSRAQNMSDVETIEALSNELVEYVELYDIWLPSENLIVTMAWNEASDTPLREFEWEGPAEGPYDHLSFVKNPDNVMPIPPASIIHDIDEAVNQAARKLIRKVANMKDVLGYRAGAVDDAENIVEAADLEAIEMENPDGVKEYHFNGPDQVSYQHIGVFKNLASQLSGNTELLGGVGQKAGTLGQEQMLQANAGTRVNSSRGKVNVFSGRIAGKHAWYMHYDPQMRVPVIRRPASGVEIATIYSPETRQGDWLDFHYNITCHTEMQMEPHVKAGRQMQWATEVVPAALNLEMMTEGGFDAMAFIRMVGKMMGVEGIDETMMNKAAMQRGQMMAEAYPFEGKGKQRGGGGQRPQGPGGQIRQNAAGHTAYNGKAQMAGGSRDKKTVSNGPMSANSQTGAMTPSGA